MEEADAISALPLQLFGQIGISGLAVMESRFTTGGNTDIETMQSLSYPDAWLEASGYKESAVMRMLRVLMEGVLSGAQQPSIFGVGRMDRRMRRRRTSVLRSVIRTRRTSWSEPCT